MKLFTRSLLTVLAVLFLFGCAAKQSSLPYFEATQFDKGEYSSKVDNFLILFDASRSLEMDHTFETARAVVTRMNETIPEWGQNAGLRSFGHDPIVSNQETLMVYGMEKYSTANLTKKFAKISKAGGFSPINKGLDAAINDLKGLSGTQNAIILISDGKDLPRDVLDAAKRLKAVYKDNICFNTIHIGDSEKGKALLDQITQIGECGVAADADDLLTSAGMADFVAKAFLHKKGTPRRVIDSDKDGITDAKDLCPDTPMGAKVNSSGCWALGHILFDFNKDQIRAVAQPLLNDVVMILEKNSTMTVELHGHCDSIGSAEYNKDLSIRRAAAVRNYLADEGIPKGRISIKGFGFDKPVTSNATAQGRAKNRRVEIMPK